MKRSLLISLACILVSCSESFRTVNPDSFNESIKGRTDIHSPEELIKLYYPYPSETESSVISIKTQPKGGGTTQTTLIHDRMEDDSVRGMKIVMTAKQENGEWTVLEIKENWKCWEGRGHTSWGTELCN